MVDAEDRQSFVKGKRFGVAVGRGVGPVAAARIGSIHVFGGEEPGDAVEGVVKMAEQEAARFMGIIACGLLFDLASEPTRDLEEGKRRCQG